MIESFANAGAEDIYNGKNTRAARAACPRELWAVAARKLDQLDSVERMQDLRIPPGNYFEALAGRHKGRFSIRINDQYRITFRWSAAGPEDVWIGDYH